VSKKNNKGDVNISIKFPDDYEGEKTTELKDDISNLALGIFKYEPLKTGDAKAYEMELYHANVECIKKSNKDTLYYLCFHAELPEDENDTDEPTAPTIVN